MSLQRLPVASENRVAVSTLHGWPEHRGLKSETWATRLPFVRVPWLNFRAPIITKSGYYNLAFCYSRTIAYFCKIAMLSNRRRFSAEHFHRFFRGRDSMKWNEESCRSYFGRCLWLALSLASLA